MSLSSWVPVLALLPPTIAATYPLLRDRSHLSRIERVTQVLKTSDDSKNSLSAGEVTILIAVRQRSVTAVGTAWAIRDYRGWLTTGISAAGWALLLVATQVWSIATNQVVAWSATASWVEAAVIGASSVYAFWGYRVRRQAARNAIENVIGPGPQVRHDGSPVSDS